MELQEKPFREIFAKIHARHPNCLADEWLTEPCRLESGRRAPRPIVWSRRNGPWRQSDLLWIGAAPGNAGGKGSGALGAHGTRIPFGGDIAGANLDALMSAIGLDRNHTFIAASYNQLPARGGGEPTAAELAAPVGDYPSSVHIVRDTILAAGPRLVVALGNIALRVVVGSTRQALQTRLPSLAQLQTLGLVRNQWAACPPELAPDPDFTQRWSRYWPDRALPALLWLTHPSAQNMSPHARIETLFFRRMLEARDALRAAARALLSIEPPVVRPAAPRTGIYALPEWRELIGPRHELLDALWRAKGI